MPAVVTILYPKTATSTFDSKYYLSSHMPLVQKLWGAHGITSWSVAELDGSAGYGFQCTINFTSLEAFQKAAASKESAEVFADVKNYTNEKPVTLIGTEIGKSG